MNERKEFAMAAMQAMLPTADDMTYEQIAKESFLMADAMMKAGTHVKEKADKLSTDMPKWTREMLNARWLKYLPESAQKELIADPVPALEEIERMVRIDHISRAEVGDLLEYMAKNWYPQFISNPSTLRKKTRAGDQRRFEAALKQMRDQKAIGDTRNDRGDFDLRGGYASGGSASQDMAASESESPLAGAARRIEEDEGGEGQGGTAVLHALANH